MLGVLLSGCEAVFEPNELPNTIGFTELNLKRMLRFYRDYGLSMGDESSRTSTLEFVSQAVAILPWGHDAILFEQIKYLPTRLWYAKQVSEQCWSRATLLQIIRSEAHAQQGKAVSNFMSNGCQLANQKTQTNTEP